jgi:hypothetical protein
MSRVNSVATIAGFMVGTMLVVAVGGVQKGSPAEQADLIPAAQLVGASLGTGSSSVAAITYHLDMITGADYGAAPYTTPLRLDDLMFPGGKAVAPGVVLSSADWVVAGNRANPFG